MYFLLLFIPVFVHSSSVFAFTMCELLLVTTHMMNYADSTSQNDMKAWSLIAPELGFGVRAPVRSFARLSSVLQCRMSVTLFVLFPSVVQLKEIPCYHQQDL